MRQKCVPRSASSALNVDSGSLNHIWSAAPFGKPFFRKQCLDEDHRGRVVDEGKKRRELRGEREESTSVCTFVPVHVYFSFFFHRYLEPLEKKKRSTGVAAAKTTNRRAQRALHALSKHAVFRRLRYVPLRTRARINVSVRKVRNIYARTGREKRCT